MSSLVILTTLFLFNANSINADILLGLRNRGLAESLGLQTTFNLPQPSLHNIERGKPDVRASPNIAIRFEVTSNSSRQSLPCGLSEDQFESGYAHLTNAAGEEDKHLFWW